jgi:NAD(P)-dependent dehydrogenase (short-subunit alcohol dehydrogenase family)
MGGTVRFLPMDVSSPDSVVATLAAAIDEFGALDYAINNAGIAFIGSTVADTEFEQWRRVMAVNLDGVFLCMREELKAMQARGKGVIINMASGAGLIGAPMMAAYSSSKHGVIGLTRSAAREYIGSGIRINAVCPAAVDTTMLDGLLPDDDLRASISAQHLENRFATPEEVANMVLFACSDEAGYSTGVEFKVNGGAVF